jgi:nucleoside-triphosphatase THEP1
MEENKTIGYDVVDTEKNEKEIFLKITKDETLSEIGKFSIFQKMMQKDYEALRPSANVNNKIVIIDEVGSLELENQGWAVCIQDLLNASNNHILLVVLRSVQNK